MYALCLPMSSKERRSMILVMTETVRVSRLLLEGNKGREKLFCWETSVKLHRQTQTTQKEEKKKEKGDCLLAL